MVIGNPVAFIVLSAATILSALGVVINRNAVYCMLSLILNLLMLALFFLMLEAEFIATVQVLVYAGAVMVLFLFVVTLLAPDTGTLEGRDRLRWEIGPAIGLAAILAGSLIVAATNGSLMSDARAAGVDSLMKQVTIPGGGSTQAFGQALFHGFAFPFEVTSLLLIVAVLGAVVLGRRITGRE